MTLTRTQLTPSDTHTIISTESACYPRPLGFCTHKLRCRWLQSWTVSGVTIFHRFTSFFAPCIIQKMSLIHYEIYFCYFSWQMKFVFRLRFTRVFVARAVHRDPFASLFICQRFSLLHFPLRSKAIFDDIQFYSVLYFPSTKPPLNSKKKT